MLRHVVLLRWHPGTTAAQLDALLAAIATLPAQIPELRAYRFGADAGLVPGNFDFAIVADFDDHAGFLTYASHPAHQRFIAEHTRPLVAERAAVQFRIFAS
ncbi:MAG: Dabb family protein [Myxococcota bacterium]